MSLLPVLLLLLLLLAPLPAHAYCARGQSCWPSTADVAALTRQLDPSASRMLSWAGGSAPRVSAVPINSPNDQPLYGAGAKSMQPVYTEEASDRSGTCFVPSASPFVTEYCLISVRNNPSEGWTPAFTVWPLTAQHVQLAVQFAVKHNLCVAVAGTGHDFLNRHSCDDGVFIRTSLLKDIEWDLVDSRGFGNKDGNVRFGAGIVFSEAHKSAADNNRFVTSGWATTVGIIGWSLGGGHGPFGPSTGLGVDNILEVELVTADGNLVVANATSNADLFWALRGGGGSTWGVVTAITVKAHAIPQGGFSWADATWNGTMCGAGMLRLDSLMGQVISLLETMDQRWAGLVFVSPAAPSTKDCPVDWNVYLQFVFQGPTTDPDFVAKTTYFSASGMQGDIFNYDTWWQRVEAQALEPIIPTVWLGPPSATYAGGLPSVLVPRAFVANGTLLGAMKAITQACVNEGACFRQELYLDITGNLNSTQDANVSVSEGMRSAMLHYIPGEWDAATMESVYALGANSYFSESAYTFAKANAWQERYWGDNYAHLLSIKTKWDPNSVFACRHCVGSSD
jgi:ribonuclease T2